MKVTGLEPIKKTKWKVYIDEQFAFVLYKGEIARYEIQEGVEISEEMVDRIKTEVLTKRAKRRALYLLSRMERTREQLRRRLEQDFYPEDVAESAIRYVEAFGYIGDADYARRYISSRQSTKSAWEMKMALLQKGIAKEEVERALKECAPEQKESDTIRRILEKKRFFAETASDAEKKKMQDYLLRKGFHYEEIRQVIQVPFWNT